MDSWPLLMLLSNMAPPLKHHQTPSRLIVHAQPPFSTVLAYNEKHHNTNSHVSCQLDPHHPLSFWELSFRYIKYS